MNNTMTRKQQQQQKQQQQRGGGLGNKGPKTVTISTTATKTPATVSIPSYQRNDLSPGIVHIGVGNFFRAHQAVYMDDLFCKGLDHDWAIIGAGVTHGSKNLRSALKDQEWLTTVVTRDGGFSPSATSCGIKSSSLSSEEEEEIHTDRNRPSSFHNHFEEEKARVIGSMIDFVPVDLEDDDEDKNEDVGEQQEEKKEKEKEENNHHHTNRTPSSFSSPHRYLKEVLLDPRIRLVTTTVTEGGYYQDENGNFDHEDPNIQHDIQNPDNPKTIYGILLEAIRKRQTAGLDPFSAILSCDNVPHAGKVVRQGLIGLAKSQHEYYCKNYHRHDITTSNGAKQGGDTAIKEENSFDHIVDDFIEYIKTNIGFPSGMVDRMVPKTTKDEISFLKDEYGIDDTAPIFCEPFRQWILEDDFKRNCRPSLEKVGVTFVKDISPYELKKLRILNGGHASLCYPAALLGLSYVHDAINHPVIGEFLDCLERREIIPTVPPIENDAMGLPEDYWEMVQHRFKNSTICDEIGRNCAQGSDRQRKFILGTVRDALKNHNIKRPDDDPIDNKSSRQGISLSLSSLSMSSSSSSSSSSPSTTLSSLPPLYSQYGVEGLALVSAMWCRYCQGTTESGDVIEPNDTLRDDLKQTALDAAGKNESCSSTTGNTSTPSTAPADPSKWLAMTDIYGNLGQVKVFSDAFTVAFNLVNEKGVEYAMKEYIKNNKDYINNKKEKESNHISSQN